MALGKSNRIASRTEQARKHVKRLELEMQVMEINDRRLGHVRAIRDCCFQVEAMDSAETFELVSAAIFTVEAQRVSLVCDRSGLSAYTCVAHSGVGIPQQANQVASSSK